ncbi:MAG: NAD-dependent epimerase/dehydratase family protein [Prevotella sp.]|nr:NAD-dependent epimerase/dehydratase family protein [Prevotella sp.]
MERKNILVTGATGLIGSALVDLFMEEGLHDVYAAGRNEERAKRRFAKYTGNSRFHFVRHDVCRPLDGDTRYHLIVHAASGADPRSFSTDPVGVMTANIDGVRNLLDYGRNHGMERLLYVSSGEVYGSDNGEKLWREEDSGYVDTMTPRACYPSSKRAAETLCVAYAAQYGLDVVVARPCHTYGANFTESDNRAYAQFMRNVVNGEDIVLNSDGSQYRSWIYVKDCAEALRTILYKGVSGTAYNVADEQSCVTIKELAELIAKAGGRNVIIQKTMPHSQDTPHSSLQKDSSFFILHL